MAIRLASPDGVAACWRIRNQAIRGDSKSQLTPTHDSGMIPPRVSIFFKVSDGELFSQNFFL